MPGRQQRVSSASAGQEPADAAADGADEQDGEQDQHREPDRDVAQPELPAAPGVDDDRAGLVVLVVDRRGAEAGRRVRVAPRVAAGVGLPPRAGGGAAAPGPAAGRVLQPALAGPAGRRRAAAPRAAAAGAGGAAAGAGRRRSRRRPPAGGRTPPAGRAWAAAPATGARREPVGRVGERTGRAGGPGEGAASDGARRPRRPVAGAGSPGWSPRSLRASRPVAAAAAVAPDGERAHHGRHDLGVLLGRRRAGDRARAVGAGTSSAGRLRASAVTPSAEAGERAGHAAAQPAGVVRGARAVAAGRGRPTRSRTAPVTVSPPGPALSVPSPPAPGTSAVNGMAHSRDIRSPGTATSAPRAAPPWPRAAPAPPSGTAAQPARCAGGAAGRAGGQLAVDQRGDGLLGEVALGDAHRSRPPPRAHGGRPRPGARWASAWRSCTRPRWIRLRTVPSLMPRVAAISS